MTYQLTDAPESKDRNVKLPEETDRFGALTGDRDMTWRQEKLEVFR